MQKSTPKHNITSKYKFFRTVQQLSTFNSIPLTYLLYTAIRFILTKIESWIVRRPPLLWHQTCSSLTYNFQLNMLLTKSSNCPYTATIVSLYHGHSYHFWRSLELNTLLLLMHFFPSVGVLPDVAIVVGVPCLSGFTSFYQHKQHKVYLHKSGLMYWTS